MIPAFAPPRQEPSLYPVLFDRDARFHELDACGEVSRPTILKWFEQARRHVELVEAGVPVEQHGVERRLLSRRCEGGNHRARLLVRR